MDKLGLGRSIREADQVCNELFVVLPEVEHGRVYLREGEGDRPFWGISELGARGTVWNTATRHGRVGDLFSPPLVRDPDPPHDPHPIRDDAADYIIENQPASREGNLIPRDALAALLLREQGIEEPIDWEGLITAACTFVGLDQDEYETITADDALEGMDPFEDSEWDPDLLPEELQPTEASAERITADRRPRGSAAVVPLRVDDRTRRMIRVSILSTSAVLLVGPPGTGKTRLLRETIEELQSEVAEFSNLDDALWTTPEESWTTREVVGGPTVVPETHEIRFRPGLVPRCIEANRWLVLDEVNRGDADRIFGGLITWLSDQPVQIGRITDEPDSPSVNLEWLDEQSDSRAVNAGQLTETAPTENVTYQAGSSWRLLGTYNGQDAQRVFRFGQALARRFQQVPVHSIHPDEFRGLLEEISQTEPLQAEGDDRIHAIYQAHHDSLDGRIGPAGFLKMRTYVAEATAAYGRTDDESDGSLALSPELLDEILAEAYVSSVGHRLARLEPTVLEEVGGALRDAGALSSDQWDWITDRLRDFG